MIQISTIFKPTLLDNVSSLQRGAEAFSFLVVRDTKIPVLQFSQQLYLAG